jgi:hypothetical protein
MSAETLLKTGSGEKIASDHPRSSIPKRSLSRPPESGGVRAAEAEFQPLATLPRDAPQSYRRRWERLAFKAGTSYRPAVELACLSCCCWERTVVKRCGIVGCPLWALRGRIFGSETLE